MFLFNESSFDNLAAHFDYSSSIINNLQSDTHYNNNNNKSLLFNSTMKISNIDQEEDNNNNNNEYFELNSLNGHTCCDNLSLLTEKQFEFDNITDYDDDDNDVTTSLSADSFTEYSFISSTTTTTSPKVLPLVKKKRNYLSKSFRSSSITNKKSIKINKYLKQSRSLVLNSIDNNQLLNEFHLKHRHQQRAKYVNKRRRTSTIIRQSNSAGNISNTISINCTNLNTINNNNVNYKPSIKVEKLLNDTRGMRKYLIDYDCLMSTKTTTTTKNSEQFNDSLLFEKFRSSFLNENSVNNNNNTTTQNYTNRCSSSGYLTSISDC